MTTILRIEHPVGDFDRWRRAFEGDPVGRVDVMRDPQARVVELVEERALGAPAAAA